MATIQANIKAIESELSFNAGENAASQYYIQAMHGIEMLNQMFNPFDLELSKPMPLTAVVAQNQAIWKDTMTELTIKHAEWFSQSVYSRLAFLTVTMVMQVSKANKAALPSSPEQDEKAASLAEEFEDL